MFSEINLISSEEEDGGNEKENITEVEANINIEENNEDENKDDSGIDG